MIPMFGSASASVAAIRTASLANLRCADWLEHTLLLALGLRKHMTPPMGLAPFRGKGLQSWQWLTQFVHYLEFLGTLAISN